MSVEPVDSLHARLAQRIFSPLARMRRRCQLYVLIDGLVSVCLAFVGAALVQVLLDWTLRLALDQRAVVAALFLSFWLWVIYRRLLAPLLSSLSDRALASVVDRAHPELHDTIATAVQFARDASGGSGFNSPQLVRAVLDEACQVASRVSFTAGLNHRLAKRRGVELAGLLLAATVAAAVVPEVAGTWFRRNWLLQDVPWPQQTSIVPIGFDDGGVRYVPRGDELEIGAINHGHVPKSVEFRWWTASGRNGSAPMTLVGRNRWQVSLGLVTEDVRFRIVGGDERTREYVIRAVERPRVVTTTTRITPPAYTGMLPVTLEQQTVLELLAGSTLEIEARFNRPVASARFVGTGDEVAPCVPLGPDRVRVEWSAPVSGSYVFELVDHNGLDNRRPVRYTLKVVPDQPPVVRIAAPDVGQSITPTAELPLELAFEDTYGLGAVFLYLQRGVDPPFALPLSEFQPGLRDFSIDPTVAVDSIGVTPGERVTLWAESHDQDPAGPNTGRSELLELRVISATDFLAELAGRELELRREFDRLISAQRGVKDALERLLPELPANGAVPAALSQRLAGLTRRQETHARNCLAISGQFQQMLAEMQVNKVVRAGDERRIAQRIVAPLEKLGRETMPAVSAMIAELRDDTGRRGADELPDRQNEILRQMQAILANMLEWEGYREAVALLQEIIATQSDVHEATVKTLERQLESILGLDEPPEEQPESVPKP